MRDSVIASVLAAGLVLGLAPYATSGVNLHHDGIMLKPALDVLSGQVLFRDTFMQYGSLTCYLQALALWIFPSLLSIRLLTVAAYAISLYFNYLSWRLLLPRPLALLAGGLFILLIPTGDYGIFLSWSSVYAMMFQSICLYGLCQVIRGVTPARHGFVLGVAGACAFWCRQPVGIILLGSLVVIGAVLHATGWQLPAGAKRKTAACVVGGFLLVNLGMFSAIALPGAWSDWWYQNFVWPSKWASDGLGAVYWRKYALPALRPVESASLVAIFLAAALPNFVTRNLRREAGREIIAYYLVLLGAIAWQHERLFRLFSLQTGGWGLAIPFFVIAQIAISGSDAFVARKQTRPVEFYLVGALAVLSLGSLGQYFPVSDPWHVMWSLSPALGLFVFVLWRWTGWRAPLLALVMTGCLGPALWKNATAFWTSVTEPSVTLAQPPSLRGMRVSTQQARELGELNKIVGRVLLRAPDIPSLLFGDDAGYLCFTKNVANPTPYYVTWEGLAPSADTARRFRYIHEVRPLLFILHPVRGALQTYFQNERYESLGYFQAQDLEIAAPREVMARTPPGPAGP